MPSKLCAEADVPPPVFDDLTAVGAFEIDVHIGGFSKSEVGADGCFKPRSSKIFLKLPVRRARQQPSFSFAFTHEIVGAGDTQVDVAAILGEFGAHADARTGDERIEVILSDADVVARSERVAGDTAVSDFHLGFDKAVGAGFEAPPEFRRQRVGVVVERSLHLLDMEVVRETTVFSDQIDEHAVVGEPRPVNGKRVEFVVRITEVVIG